MNEPDLTGIEADLRKLKPAEPPPAFMDRLVAATETAAQPRRVEPNRQPAHPTLWELLWPVLRWLIPGAVAVNVLILVFSRPAPAPKVPGSPETTHAPLKADDVLFARKLVGTFDAVAELPSGETVRFRCREWTDKMTLRDADRGVEVVQSTPSFEVIPVRLETY